MLLLACFLLVTLCVPEAFLCMHASSLLSTLVRCVCHCDVDTPLFLVPGACAPDEPVPSVTCLLLAPLRVLAGLLFLHALKPSCPLLTLAACPCVFLAPLPFCFSCFCPFIFHTLLNVLFLLSFLDSPLSTFLFLATCSFARHFVACFILPAPLPCKFLVSCCCPRAHFCPSPLPPSQVPITLLREIKLLMHLRKERAVLSSDGEEKLKASGALAIVDFRGVTMSEQRTGVLSLSCFVFVFFSFLLLPRRCLFMLCFPDQCRARPLQTSTWPWATASTTCSIFARRTASA